MLHEKTDGSWKDDGGPSTRAGNAPYPTPNNLIDSDPMPFGKYKGQCMEDIPASYLHYLWINGKQHDKLCPVACYIRKNLNILKYEHPDGIW